MKLLDMASRWVDIVLALIMTAVLLVATLTPILMCILPGRASVTSPYIVVTPTGRYEGKAKTLHRNHSVVRYAGIPFAQPPVGNFRFRRPQPIQEHSSDRVIDAKNIQKSCWGATKKISNPYYSEDCLYLNVYVPASKQNSATPFAVMVWIHGGGFVAGTVFPEPWSFVDRGQVIVVTVNYRLGVLGFLTTEDEALPANLGLWDQVMALQWVKDNIQYFGGDSNSITLFGESAGAMSSALLTLSPFSANLFNKVIFQSGAANSLISRNPLKTAKEFGHHVGCNFADGRVVFASCLRNTSVAEILEHSKSITMSAAEKQVDFIWMPTIDRHLIPDEPISLLKNATYLTTINAFDRDYLFGCNNNEGSLLLENFFSPISSSVVEDIAFFRNLTEFQLSMYFGISQELSRNISDLVMSFYTGSPLPDKPMKETLLDFFADGMFYAPEILMANALSGCYTGKSPDCKANLHPKILQEECGNATGRTFLYYFDFCPPVSDDDCKLTCMIHALDLKYEFPRKEFSDDIQQQLSNRFIDLLTTFSKTSRPDSVILTGFPAYEESSQKYLSFSPYPSVRQFLHHERMNLWTRTIPALIEEYDKFE